MKNFFSIFVVLVATLPLNIFATFEPIKTIESQNDLKGCINPNFPKLAIDNHSGSLDAGKMNIKSNGEIQLDENIYMPIDGGNLKASKATYFQEENRIQEILNGNIYHLDNYFQFKSGSLKKDSGKLELNNGKTFLRDRNLLISYQSLKGILGKGLIFENASITSCNNISEGWEIEAERINVDEQSSRGHIKNLRLKVRDRTVLKLPYLPFPATTKRLNGFLEPDLSITSDGLDVFLPYFWVLSSKSDVTIAPRLLKDRGQGVEANLRYRTQPEAENYLDVLLFPEDKEFKKDYVSLDNRRWAFKLKEHRKFAAFATTIDWAKSSDSMVLLDLPSNLTNIANQRDHYLSQSVALGMNLDNLSINISREGYQSLNPFLSNGYIKKPGVNVEYAKYSSNLSYFLKADYSNFDVKEMSYIDMNQNQLKDTGKRVITEIGGEVQQDSKYINMLMSGSLLQKKYNLDGSSKNNSSTSIPSIKLKISSLFRQSTASRISLITPELVYQKTTYKDQSQDPIFDLHQRNIGNFNTHNSDYFFGKDRIPDSEFLSGSVKWQTRLKNLNHFSVQIIKKNQLKESRVINAMLLNPIGKESQLGANISFDNKVINAFLNTNYSQKNNFLNYGKAGLIVRLPETQVALSRSFQRNVPLLNNKNELDYAELAIEHLMYGGFNFIGGISKDLESKKNLETYFGFGFENCCLAFKVYASDKRLSKYNLLNFQPAGFYNSNWEKMISIENKSRINFEFELKGLTGGNKAINNFFSNAFMNL